MNFFLPAMSLMARLRFGLKFALSGLVVFAFLIYLGFSQTIALHHRVQSLAAERAAVGVVRLLVDWNKVLIESRRIAITAKPGDESVRQAWKQNAALVDAKLLEIEGEVTRVRPFFDMSQQVKGLREGWVALQGKMAALALGPEFAQKAFVAHAPEYGRLYAFLRELGDRSGLALEPDLDLFYLGYPLANNTPSTAGIAVRIAAYTTLNIARGTLTPADKIFYEVTEARLNDTFGTVESMLSQSMKANAVVDARLSKKFSTLKNASKDYLAFVRRNFTATDSISTTEPEAAQAAQATIDAAWALVAENRAVLADLLDERMAGAATQRNLIFLLLVAGILLSLYLYVGMFLSIRRSLAAAGESVRAIAAGYLGRVANADSHDEIAELIDDLRRADQALTQMIQRVRGNAEAVSAASSQIASGNNDLSARTESQASALEKTASSMEELGSTVRHNADNAQQANELARNASSVAVRGGEVVAEVVQTMRDINESSRKITEIISVIDGIAFQTNILALNAAVEAARAGEQGRGFAVVASEVRLLASRSAEAAREIKALIDASVQRVEHGTSLVGRAGETMSDVVSSIRRVADIMGEISVASKEQSTGVSQVGEAIQQMDQSTQQNSALVEEMAAAAASLNAQAQDLVLVVSEFRTGGHG